MIHRAGSDDILDSFPMNFGNDSHSSMKMESFTNNSSGEEQKTSENDRSSRENTGRWTREEHNLFLRGLELHGKGWKKIAALIKSRTVVQIRTHAQKYFLKMHKARQEIDASGNLSLDGKFHGSGYRKLRKRRYDDIPLSLAPAIKPFVRQYTTFPNAEGDANAIATTNTDDGIYNFLSPQLESPTTLPSSTVAALTPVDPNSKSDSTQSVETVQVTRVPKWFHSGGDIATLLQDAQRLNWLMDSGHMIEDISMTTNTMAQDVIDGLKPPTVAIPIPYNEPTTRDDVDDVYEHDLDPDRSTGSSDDASLSPTLSSHGHPIHTHPMSHFTLNNHHEFEDINREFATSEWMTSHVQSSMMVNQSMSHHSDGLDDDLIGAIDSLYPESLSVY